MKTNKNIENEVNTLMKKARRFPCESSERNDLILKICRLYDPVRFPVFDESVIQVEF